MPRPFLMRTVGPAPPAVMFKPAGVPARTLQWVHMLRDEHEAIRMVAGEGLDQETVARHMGVSRPTVTRILARARAKVAQMLTQGAALVIGGGPVVPADFVGPPGGGRRGRGWGGPPPGPAGPPGGMGRRGMGRGRRRGFGRGRNS